MLSQPAVPTGAQSESLWAVSNREKVFQSLRLVLSFSDWLLIWSQTDLSTLDRDVLCVFVCAALPACAHTAGVSCYHWKQSCSSLPPFLLFCSLFCKGGKELFTACGETWPWAELLRRQELIPSSSRVLPASLPAPGCQCQCCSCHGQTAAPPFLPWLPSSQSTGTCLAQSMRGISLNLKRCTWIWN